MSGKIRPISVSGKFSHSGRFWSFSCNFGFRWEWACFSSGIGLSSFSILSGSLNFSFSCFLGLLVADLVVAEVLFVVASVVEVASVVVSDVVLVSSSEKAKFFIL